MTFNGVSMGACVRSCTHDGDCDGGQICTILSNTRAARNDLLCLDAFGDGPPGTDCTAVSACTHALCSSTADGNWCTNACETDAECPAAKPRMEGQAEASSRRIAGARVRGDEL
jgi:hypothetical protein